MSKKRFIKNEPQLALDFKSLIQQAQVLSRDDVVAQASADETDSPVERTAAYMRRSLEVEKAWETTLREARETLTTTDARIIYLDLILGIKKRIEAGDRSAQLANLLEQVAYRGLGMGRHQLQIHKPTKGGMKWRVELVDWQSIQDHIEKHIVGPTFLVEYHSDSADWKGTEPLIGASDISQHRSLVPIPSRFFKRRIPFILNNAAGTLLRKDDGVRRFEPLFNPRPDEALLHWMLLDPSYQDELDPEDYVRCIASAMDVGQYRFDLEYLLSADKRPPDIVLRDGSLFPQDAYLTNFLINNRRGEFTREAIIGLLKCLRLAEDLRTLYCGVAKSVRLKVYSAALDWYIHRFINSDWDIGGYTLNDGEAMSLLLASPDFVESGLNSAVGTCLIRRSFTTRANLNTRVSPEDLDRYFNEEQVRAGDAISIVPYRRLCEVAHEYMFFVGHSKSPHQRLPRYEFFYYSDLGKPLSAVERVLDALRQTGLQIDRDHSLMATEPVEYLLPSVTQQAHQFSKDVGKHIDSLTGAWIMARYIEMTKNSA